MKINRDELLAALKIIKPAIATRDLVEEFTHVWFTGKHLVAGNDVGFGIRVPFESEFKGGVRGTLLLGLANATRTKEFELEPGTEETVIIKAGRARAVLAVFPIKKMLTAVPDEKAKTFKITKELSAAFEKVLISSGSETRAMPEQKGVTLVNKDGGLQVFATDGATIAHAACKKITECPSSLLPTDFVEAVVHAGGKDNSLEMCISKGQAFARNENILIFCNHVHNENPKDLVKITNDALKDAVFVPIPARLKLALARASVLLEKQKEEHIRFSCEGAVLRIKASTQLGDLKDTIALDKEVPTVEAMINPSFIQRALATTSRMFIGEKAMVLSGDDFNYFIAYKG